MAEALTPPDAVENCRFLVVAFRRDENRDRFADHLFGRVAEEPLCSPVPSGDDAVEVLAYDGIIRGLDDGGTSLRCVRGLQRLINCRRESAQVGHQTQVFRVETATLVMGDYPYRADGFAPDVKRNQQSFCQVGLDLAEVGKVAFGV